MAIAFVGATEYYAGGNSEDHTIPLPSFSQDDLMILHFQQSGNFDQNGTVVGFTQLTPWSTTSGSMGGTAIYYRIMQSGDSSDAHITYTPFNGLRIVVNTVCYSGNAIVSPFDSDSHRDPWDNGTSASPVSEALTTGSTNTMILRIMSADDEDSTEGSVFPSGVTNRAYQQIGTPGNGGNLSFGEQGIQSATGTTGTKTWSLDTSSEVWVTQTIAIRDISNDVVINNKDVTFDGRLVKVFTEDVTFDSALSKTFNKDTTYDSILSKTISKDITYDSVLAKTISKSFTFDAGLNTLVSNTLTGKHDINNLTGNTLDLLYDINNFIFNTLTSIYSIGGRVSNTLTGIYDINNHISNTLTLSYDILSLISNTITGLFDISNFVSNVSTFKHDILNHVSNTSTIRYDILSHVSNTIIGLYDILERIPSIPVPNKIRTGKTLKDNNTVNTGTGTAKTINT